MIQREYKEASPILDALPASLRGSVRVLDRDGGCLVRLTGPDGTRLDFAPVWAGEGFPRDVEAALALREREVGVTSGHVVITARRLSMGAREQLDTAGMSWADESGDAHIEVPPALYIVREARNARKPAGIVPSFRWNASSGAIAEYLLAGVAERVPVRNDNAQLDLAGVSFPRARELATALQWSPAQVAKSLRGFDSRGWLARTGAQRGRTAGRVWADPGAMLTSWGDWYRSRTDMRTAAHCLTRDVEDFAVGRLGPVMTKDTWALSGWLALNAVAPFITHVPDITCYLAPDVYDYELTEIMNAADLRPVTEGARVYLVRADPYVITQSHLDKGLPLVSSIRLYGDLLKAGPRGVEAAQHLREVSIGF